jgi:Flp pilus assembly pilin Flp
LEAGWIDQRNETTPELRFCLPVWHHSANIFQPFVPLLGLRHLVEMSAVLKHNRQIAQRDSLLAEIQGEEMGRIISFVNSFHNDESGQGLVEYLLIVALVALAATAGMTQAASYINSAFVRIGQKLGGYIS